MNSPLIFTEQRILPRIIDILITLCAWLGYIWLIGYGILSLMNGGSVIVPHFIWPELQTFLFYFLIALVNALMIILWAKYNQYRFSQERRQRVSSLLNEDIATSFSVQPEEMDMLNRNQIQRVWHDGQGHIARIESLDK
ncbi:poly-beta-1,6-N-acetyl-D-glucosamine biosynthesis protein PgaD [Pectobacterium sp. B1J-3]|uniref:poly-beta-1,6-N-acetyl-D-glucosamine biosynthesis protein PgaD n=1 Tax=Pectobacterium sp. B1J-3 TaxID=3385371 RepID=UPI003905BBD9